MIELIIGFVVWKFVLGDPSHFQGGDPAGHPLEGDYFGIFYKGGYLVPLAIGLLLMTLTFAIERIITIGRAKGKGNIKTFVQRIRTLIAARTGDTSLPQIYIGGEHLGGVTDLFDAWRLGVSQRRLAENGVIFDRKVKVDADSFLPNWLRPRLTA